MKVFIKYSGLLTVISIWLMLALCFTTLSAETDRFPESISQFGSVKETSLYFKSMLVIASISTVFFTRYVFQILKIHAFISRVITITLPISLIGIALITTSENRPFHWFFSVSFFLQLIFVLLIISRNCKTNTFTSFTRYLVLFGLIITAIEFIFVKGLAIPTFVGFILMNVWVFAFYIYINLSKMK
jgi:hypothetical protein